MSLNTYKSRLITDWQRVPDETWGSVDDLIQRTTEQWQTGSIKDVAYHTQVCILYAVERNVTKCKEHAALVSEGASNHQKAETMVSLGRINIYEKNIPQAIAYYEKALQLDATHETALEEIAWCHFDCQQYAEAEPYFRQYLKEIDYLPERLGRLRPCISASAKV